MMMMNGAKLTEGVVMAGCGGEQCEICNAPKREWVGLTDEEIFRADPRIGTSDSNVNPYQILINARAIEAMLKERNNG